MKFIIREFVGGSFSSKFNKGELVIKTIVKSLEDDRIYTWYNKDPGLHHIGDTIEANPMNYDKELRIDPRNILNLTLLDNKPDLLAEHLDEVLNATVIH